MTILAEDSGAKTVSVAGTAEAVGTTQKVVSLTIEALDTNTGNIYVGNANVDNTRAPLSAGKRWQKEASVLHGNSILFDIAEIFVDVDTGGEGYNFWWTAD